MQKQLEALGQFNKAFNIPENDSPQLIEGSAGLLRFKLMEEENNEYLDAVIKEDLTEIADALTDQLYILCGTIRSHGLQHIIEKCFDEVHSSNMSKLDDNGQPIINGENGVYDTLKPIGKVIKSKNFVEPNLKQFI